MDQKLKISSHYKLLPVEGSSDEDILARVPQTIKLKKGDIISWDLIKRWSVVKNQSWKIMWIDESIKPLPKCCLRTFRDVNKIIDVDYKKIHTISFKK